MPAHLISCPVQHYPWGSLHAIPKLLNKENPNAKPWAELWMGTHPRGCATLNNGKSLSDFITTHPAACLGKHAKQWDQKLPFLFKILAAKTPLSMQCHPNKEQAIRGFAKENEKGIPLDAPYRNYLDSNHKPEFIVALNEFWALKGFRPIQDIVQRFRSTKIVQLKTEIDRLENTANLKEFFLAMHSLPQERSSLLLKELLEGVDSLSPTESHWTKQLMNHYPGDIGACSVLLFHLIKLKSGQGMYVNAGEPHAYLHGLGLELMASSDNVLRGGLTAKHIDKKELMRILRFAPSKPQIILPIEDANLQRYHTPAKEFSLSYLALSLKPKTIVPGASIVLALQGDSQLQWQGGELLIPHGQIAFCTANTGNLCVSGKGKLWIASIPS